MTNEKKFIVFGCGPAGLMSAHAAQINGYDVTIISQKRKSEMYGAQYLHKPIPMISNDEDAFQISYQLKGTEQQYREKVYGREFNGKVSPEDLVGDHDGWDIRSAYDKLWRIFQEEITDVKINMASDFESIINAYPDAIFASSIPAPLLCSQGHAFSGEEVWAMGDAPERGVFSPVKVPTNTVVCNGLPDNGWYRASNIQGYHTVEWPKDKRPPIAGISSVTKPIATNCDCLPQIHRVGRYGTWTKGVLSHEAFDATMEGLKDNS